MERDRAVETLLRSRGLHAAGDACLEPETLAAWVDGGLSGDQAAKAESHVADCARCQAFLATLVKTAALVPASEPWWRRRWGVGILVPLAAGAAAIALWVASPAYQPPSTSMARIRTDSPPKPEASVVDQLRVPPSPTNEGRQQAPAETPVGSRDEAKKDAGDSTRQKAQAEVEEQARADDKPRALADLQKLEADKASETLSSAVQAAATPAAALAPSAAPSSPASAVQDAGAAGRLARAPARALGAAQNAISVREIASPNPAIRWRIGASGSIQYSSDGGTSWQPAATGVTTDLMAGSSPSLSICWVVGRSGTVLLTLDAVRWQRVPFPETVDLTAVQASDGRTATVRTADSRSFRTADAGATWSVLQDF